jgi:hypothetical protein
MTAKKSAKSSTAKKASAPDTLNVKDGVEGVKIGMTDSQVIATVVTRSGMSASTLKAYSSAGDSLEVTDLMNELVKAGDEVVAGNMGRMERMLTQQAITLNVMFNTLAKRSSSQDYMKQMETYMRLALKAQAQARATVEALALLKNPQPYIRQANIAQGNQQVNNGAVGVSGGDNIPQYAQARTGADDSHSSPNKLLEAHHAQRLDIGTEGAPSKANSDLEAVGTCNRT